MDNIDANPSALKRQRVLEGQTNITLEEMEETAKPVAESIEQFLEAPKNFRPRPEFLDKVFIEVFSNFIFIFIFILLHFM